MIKVVRKLWRHGMSIGAGQTILTIKRSINLPLKNTLRLFQSGLLLNLFKELIRYLPMTRNLREALPISPMLVVGSRAWHKAILPEETDHLSSLNHGTVLITILTHLICSINCEVELSSVGFSWLSAETVQ